jgi:hypothetical protein
MLSAIVFRTQIQLRHQDIQWRHTYPVHSVEVGSMSHRHHSPRRVARAVVPSTALGQSDEVEPLPTWSAMVVADQEIRIGSEVEVVQRAV